MLRLVASSHRVPANLWLADVQDGEEKARGGYGVVNKGSWEGKEVALKFPHNSATDHYKVCIHSCDELQHMTTILHRIFSVR